jgi:hypothetical protein
LRDLADEGDQIGKQLVRLVLFAVALRCERRRGCAGSGRVEAEEGEVVVVLGEEFFLVSFGIALFGQYTD